jgi:hypothetical protein
MTPQEMQELYKRQLWRLYHATKYLNDPSQLALIINRRLCKIDNGGLVRGIIQTRFLTGGVSGGFPWPNLADKTVEQRARQGYGPSGPILKRSGFLKDAAVLGTLNANAEQIVLTFKDGPAPQYVSKREAIVRVLSGKSSAKRKKVNRVAIVNNARGAHEATGRLSDYAGDLNRSRPFYGAPQPNELAPLFEARNRIIAAAVSAIANGRSMFAAIESTE